MNKDSLSQKRKIMGIDYGSKKVGVAISNPERTIAFPKTIVSNKGLDDITSKIISIANEENVEKIIIGWSVDEKGEENPIAKEIRACANKLEENSDLSMDFENESMTTLQAALSGKKGALDSSAAALILQSYLESEKCD